MTGGDNIRVGEEDRYSPKQTHITLPSSSPASKLTSIHIAQGIGNTIEVLEEAVVIDMLCVRANTILMAHYPDVRIYLAHSCSSCVRFQLLGRDGGGAVIHMFTY